MLRHHSTTSSIHVTLKMLRHHSTTSSIPVTIKNERPVTPIIERQNSATFESYNCVAGYSDLPGCDALSLDKQLPTCPWPSSKISFSSTARPFKMNELRSFETSKPIIQWVSKYINVLTPWSRVLPEKLPGPRLVKKFPAFYGIQTSISAFTTARHLSLSWARSIQPMPPSRFLKTHFNIILPSTPEPT